MYTELDGIAALHQALLTTRAGTGDLLNKVGYSLQISIAKVTFRSNDFTSFKVLMNETESPAVLLLNPKFYVLNGYPKLGEYVTVVHNTGQNIHIVYSGNPKDINDPPLGGVQSRTVGMLSSAKCSL